MPYLDFTQINSVILFEQGNHLLWKSGELMGIYMHLVQYMRPYYTSYEALILYNYIIMPVIDALQSIF